MRTKTTLIGRRRELAVLLGGLAEVDRGSCGVISISGEPGIGKTRLLFELRARATDGPRTVLVGRGTELEREAPFAALIEALDEHLGSLPHGRREQISRRLPLLTDVFPALGGAGLERPGSAPERYRRHRALAGLLRELGAHRPLVLALDDLQWADAASVEAVAHLIRHPPAAPVLLAVAYRSGQISPLLTGALVAAARDGIAQQLELTTLSPADTERMLPDVPTVERERILVESGGNPFYIEQLSRARAVLAPRRRAAGRGAEPDDAGVPAAVTQAIDEELRHLPAGARLFLEGAAVAGDPFDAELAADAVSLSPQDALELLDALVERDLVRPAAGPRLFRLRHPLVRRAVYNGIAPDRRIAAHRSAAAALAELGAPAQARAHHLALSAGPGDEDAIATLAAAAVEVQSSAPASAARWLAAAVGLLPSEQHERRLALLTSLAELQVATGALSEGAETLTELTRGLPVASSEWSRAIAKLASVELELGRHAGAQRRLEEAVELLGDSDAPQLVPLLLALALDFSYQDGDFVAAADLAQRAMSVSDRAGDAHLRAASGATLAAILTCAGDVGRGGERATAASLELDDMSDHLLAGGLEAPYRLGIAETFLERYEDGARHLRRGLSVAHDHGNSQFIIQTRTFLTYCLLQLGRVEDALASADETVETGRLLRLPAGIAWGLAVAALAWSVVDARRTLTLGEEAVAVLETLDDSIITDATHAHVAWAYANAGEPERCLHHMRLAGAPRFDRFEPGRRCFFAEALVRSHLALGDVAGAREWSQRGLRFASGTGLQVAEAAAARGQALVLLADGEASAAVTLAERAAGGADAGHARLESARSRIVGFRAGAVADPKAAITGLHAVRKELGSAGARRLEHEVVRELRALGVSAPTPVPRGVGDAGATELSPREREVVALVAAGKSNPQIAASLYLSTKTIEGHMRRIFAKLDVSSRAEVAAAVTRDELSDEPERAGSGGR